MRRYVPLSPGTGLSRSPFPPRSSQPRTGGGITRQAGIRSATPRTGAPKTRSRTGFSLAVKVLVCHRAGHGDPDMATCEACGVFVGWNRGEYQHIVARGMGGCKVAVINSAANCALLCHSCHALAESRDARMEAAGFWARQGTDPRLLPMKLASEGGPRTVWRSMDGQYLFEAPEAEAA